MSDKGDAALLAMMALAASYDPPFIRRRARVSSDYIRREPEVKPKWKPAKIAISPAEYRRRHMGKQKHKAEVPAPPAEGEERE